MGYKRSIEVAENVTGKAICCEKNWEMLIS